MFFVLNLEKNLLVHPAFLGRNIDKHLHHILEKSVQGLFIEAVGYILRVITVNQYGQGKVQDGSGDVMFPISYKALVFVPYRGQILDAQVKDIFTHGFLASAGPMDLFVASEHISEEYYFDLEARPSQRWINKENPSKIIHQGSDVRVKVTGIRVTANEMYGICEMADQYLGPLELSNSVMV